MTRNATRTTRWGGADVEVLERAWPSARDVVGYRKTYALRPGERWRDAPVTLDQYEHLVDDNGEVLPVGVIIARELVESGADWAYCVELWGSGIVLLDVDAVCAPIHGPVATLLDELRAANGGRLGGLPDVIGRSDHRIHFREAKLGRGRDALRPNQHAFMQAQRSRFGDLVDAAVVEWQVSEHSRGTTTEITDPAS